LSIHAVIGESHSNLKDLTQLTSTMRTIIEVYNMRMHNPPYPGEILRELCIEPLGLSVTRAAEALGVSRKTLSAILNQRAGISPEMAIRLSKAFGTSAESWLNQQVQFDLWIAETNSKDIDVEKLSAA
jgi:addiction module HigA family antidote